MYIATNQKPTWYGSNAALAHAWANTSTEKGRNSNGSLSFEYDRIYSYNTLIAEFRGESYLIFNERKYSVTTSAHQSLILNSIGYNCRIITIDSTDYSIGSFLKYTKERIGFVTQKLKKARKKEIYISIFNKIKQNIGLYLEFFEDVEYSGNHLELQSNLDFTELKEIYNQMNPEIFAIEALGCNIEKLEQKRKIKEEKARESFYLQRKADIEKSVKDFREHKRNDVLSADMIGTDLVRLSKTGKLFVTARRAAVPFEAGLRLFRLIQRVKQRAAEKAKTQDVISFQRRNIRLGDFKLDYINKNGDCQIGCHRFKYEELERCYNEEVVKVNFIPAI